MPRLRTRWRGVDMRCEKGGSMAGAARGGSDLPWGLECGAGVSFVQGPAAGDSAAVRAPGRPNPGTDPSGDSGLARLDAVRDVGAPGPGTEWREAQGVVSRSGEAGDRSSHGQAGAGGGLPGADHADAGGNRGRVCLASDSAAGAGETGARLPEALRGAIHTISHKFRLSTLSIR